jgi:NAD(P)-dependent dehydrogenase (short-subunit alcohol dehydrogenase family)
MKNVLVSGGAGGIGCAIVKELVSNGYNPIILDYDSCNCEKIKSECNLNSSFIWSLDVTDVDSLRNFCANLSSDFEIDHIVSLAGRALENEWQLFENQDICEIKKSIELNLMGHINVIHTFFPFLKRSSAEKKSITLISSINAFGDFGLPAYSASKSGMYGLVKCLCSEFGRYGIRINSISPGTIVTPATELEPKNFDELKNGTAIGEFATKEEVANYVRFIMETQGITGQNAVIDAGQSTILKR